MKSAHWINFGSSFKFARVAVAILLLLALILPTVLVILKAAILGLAVFLSLLCIQKKACHVSVQVWSTSIFYCFIGIIWSGYGALEGNPGALRVLTVMALYPIVLTVLIPLYRINDEGLAKLFVAAAWIIVTLDLAFVLSNVFSLDFLLDNMLRGFYGDEWAVVDLEQGYLKFTLPNVSSVIFLLPFVVTATLSNYRNMRQRLMPWLLIFGLVTLAFLSGRRGLLISSITGIAFAYLIISPRALFSPHLVVLACGVVLVFFLLNAFFFEAETMEYWSTLFSSVFDFSEDASNLERRYQFDSLLGGIVDQPIIGHGAGAVAKYVRSEEFPWSYELFYVAISFQYGLLGLVIYGFGVAVITYALWIVARQVGVRSFEFCFLSGFLSFMIASATNPYLAKFDYMWIIFIPVAVLNALICRRRVARPLTEGSAAIGCIGG